MICFINRPDLTTKDRQSEENFKNWFMKSGWWLVAGRDGGWGVVIKSPVCLLRDETRAHRISLQVTGKKITGNSGSSKIEGGGRLQAEFE
jgi:hypothetical protein